MEQLKWNVAEKEVAVILHRSKRTVRRLLANREIEHVELSPRNRLVSEAQLDEYLSRHTVKLPKKLDPRVVYDKVVGNSSLTTYGGEIADDLDVKSLRKEITRLSWLSILL